jgi:hypothetical protein
MDQVYKGFLISGEAGMVHPFSRHSYPAGTICKRGRAGSIVEVAVVLYGRSRVCGIIWPEGSRLAVDTYLSSKPGFPPERNDAVTIPCVAK